MNGKLAFKYDHSNGETYARLTVSGADTEVVVPVKLGERHSEIMRNLLIRWLTTN